MEALALELAKVVLGMNHVQLLLLSYGDGSFGSLWPFQEPQSIGGNSKAMALEPCHTLAVNIVV